MIKLSRKTAVLGGGGLLLLMLPLIAEWLGEPFLISLCSRILIYALAAVSLDLILGYGGMVSFGHAAFFGAGAYTVGILAFHHMEDSPLPGFPESFTGSENALLTLPLAMLLSALLAALIGAISLRTRGVYFIMITLAFAQMMFYLFVSLEAYGGDDGLSLWQRNTLPGLDLGDRTSFYYLCLVLLGTYLVFCRRLVDARFGMVIRGCKQNEARLRALGFPTYGYKLSCFIIAGAGAGLAGALMTNQNEFVSPTLLHWTQSGQIMIMVILGGMGTLYGPILGAFTLLLMEELLSVYTEHWGLFLGPFLIFVVLFAKRGVYGVLAGHEAADG